MRYGCAPAHDPCMSNHVERTYAKIGVPNRIGASTYALRNGLVKNT